MMARKFLLFSAVLFFFLLESYDNFPLVEISHFASTIEELESLRKTCVWQCKVMRKDNKK